MALLVHFCPRGNKGEAEERLFPPVLLAIVLVLVAIGALLSVLRPWQKKAETRPVIAEKYQLPELYTQADLVRMIGEMSMDPVFKFYFENMSPDHVQLCIRQLVMFLDGNRGQYRLKAEILRQQGDLEMLSSIFLVTQFTPDYFKNPSAHQDLSKLLWRYLVSEFKVVVLSVLYQSTYQKDYVLQWRDPTIRDKAAGKMRNILTQIPSALRKEVSKTIVLP